MDQILFAAQTPLSVSTTTSVVHANPLIIGRGFVTGWIDAAMAHAAIALKGPDFVPMSLEIKVSFFAPARPGVVIAEAWVEKEGFKTSFFEGHLKDTNGTVLAKATSTVLHADWRKVEQASQSAKDDV